MVVPAADEAVGVDLMGLDQPPAATGEILQVLGMPTGSGGSSLRLTGENARDGRETAH